MSPLATAALLFATASPPDSAADVIGPEAADLWPHTGAVEQFRLHLLSQAKPSELPPEQRAALLQEYADGATPFLAAAALKQAADDQEHLGRLREAADLLGNAAARLEHSPVLRAETVRRQAMLLAESGDKNAGIAALSDLPDLGPGGVIERRHLNYVRTKTVGLTNLKAPMEVVAALRNSTPNVEHANPALRADYTRFVFVSTSNLSVDPSGDTAEADAVYQLEVDTLSRHGGGASVYDLDRVIQASEKRQNDQLALGLSRILIEFFPDSSQAPPQLERLRQAAAAAGDDALAAKYEERLLSHPRLVGPLRDAALKRTGRTTVPPLKPAPDPAFSPPEP